jgi:hypothetical protein
MSRELLSSAFRQGAEATAEADRVLQQLGGIHEPQEESQIVEVQPLSPRFRTKFIESISYIKKTLEHATDIVNKKVLPLVATTKDIISPRAIFNNTIQLSAEARDILIHNPEIITGLFYSVMFYDSNPELHDLIDLEIARDPRLSGAYNALKALVGGGAAGFLSKQVVENLLQFMPRLKEGGIKIFKQLGYQKPEALYDAHVEGAIQSLDTDHPFYLPIEDQQAAPYGSLLLGPSAAAPLAIGPPPSSGSLLLGPSAAAPLAIAPPPSAAASSSSAAAASSAAASSSGAYVQPSTVFNVTGMNTMAPSGPPPRRGPGRPPGPSSKPPPLIRPNIIRVQQGDLQPVGILPSGSSPKGKSSLLSPKAAYVERLRRGDFAEGSGLVKTSKKHLSLPYFDNYNDPYVFRNK